MNFYMINYSIHYVKANSDNFKEDVAYVKFFDNDYFVNANSFLASLSKVKKLRITAVEWEVEEANWWDYDENISNTYH